MTSVEHGHIYNSTITAVGRMGIPFSGVHANHSRCNGFFYGIRQMDEGGATV